MATPQPVRASRPVAAGSQNAERFKSPLLCLLGKHPGEEVRPMQTVDHRRRSWGGWETRSPLRAIWGLLVGDYSRGTILAPRRFLPPRRKTRTKPGTLISLSDKRRPLRRSQSQSAQRQRRDVVILVRPNRPNPALCSWLSSRGPCPFPPRKAAGLSWREPIRWPLRPSPGWQPQRCRADP